MKVVIVGGGFGGVRAALELARRGFEDVTLISERNYFLVNSSIYQIVAGRDSRHMKVPLREIFANQPKVKLITDKISSIDIKKKLIKGKKKGYAYDKLILATGIENNFHGVNGADKHSFSFGAPEDIEAFSKTLHDKLISADDSLHCVIVGGGAVGVELAGVLQSYAKKVKQAHGLSDYNLKLVIAERRRRLVPELSKTASKKVTSWLKRQAVKPRLGVKIDKISKDYLIINGRKSPASMVIWACGGQVGPIFTKSLSIFRLSKHGRVVVNDYLLASPDIYVIGDSAETPHSGLAKTAIRQADFVAKNLSRLRENQPQKVYRPGRRPMISLKLDEFWSYSEFGGVYVAGLFGSWMEKIVKINQLNCLLPYQKAVQFYKKQQNAPEICRLCQKQRKINH